MPGLVLFLPPSETKRGGGDGPPLDLSALTFPGLLAAREQAVEALITASADDDAGARMLRLGPSQRGELAHNRALLTSPTLPALDRYTGVLFDALDAASLDRVARRWLGAHALIHSAPFGPIGALDAVPAYRLGATASVPGLPSLRRVWAAPVSAALAAASPSFVLDLRSEAYVALGPVPPGVPSAWVRVVSRGSDGVTRALNHSNKQAKGALVRALAEARPRATTLPGILRWAHGAGWRMRSTGPGIVDLEV